MVGRDATAAFDFKAYKEGARNTATVSTAVLGNASMAEIFFRLVGKCAAAAVEASCNEAADSTRVSNYFDGH